MNFNAERVAAALGRYSRQNKGFLAQCPAHDDKNPSLSISDAEDGKLLVHCKAGCGQESVVGALKDRGLWPTEVSRDTRPAKQVVAGRYTYHDQDGKVFHVKERLEPGKDGRKKDFRFFHENNGVKSYSRRGGRKLLYNLHKVIPAKAVTIHEGEKHADVVTSWGLVGTTLDSGADSKLTDEQIEQLAGKRIAIICDNDPPGLKYAQHLASDLDGKCESLKIVQLPGLPPKGDICDWIKEPGNDKARFIQIIKETAEYEPQKEMPDDHTVTDEPEAWPEPLLFGEIQTPPIPASLLPSWIGDFCKAVADATQTPPGMSVMFALSTVATCIQKRFEVCPKGDDYTEPVNVWTVTALEPGNRKTAVRNAFTAPLTIWEQEQADLLAPKQKEIRHRRDINQKAIDQLKAKAAKPDTPPADREETIREITRIERETPDEIHPPRLWTDDVTPERLQSLLADQGERMGLLSDEGGIFEVMAGLYSNGKANLNVFLQGHAGASVRVDRQGRGVVLNKPALSFGLTVQPDVIAELGNGGKARFRGNGTLARFLYCLPQSTIGNRDMSSRATIPEAIKAAYHAGIMRLLAIPPVKDELGNERARILTLSPDALLSWVRFSQYIESNQGPHGEFYSFQDWTSKLPGAALRIAGIFHVVEHGEQVSVIDAQTMESALDLAETLIIHARAAFDLMGDDVGSNDAKVVLQWIQKSALSQFSQKEAMDKNRRFRTVDRLERAMRVLSSRHIVGEPEKRITGGRPSIIYTVNPEITNPL